MAAGDTGEETVGVIGRVRFNADGLVPAVVQGAGAGRVLTLGTPMRLSLRDAEMDYEDLVQLNFFVTSRDDYATARRAFGQVWKQLCGRHFPGMAMFMVSSLFDPVSTSSVGAGRRRPDSNKVACGFDQGSGASKASD